MNGLSRRDLMKISIGTGLGSTLGLPAIDRAAAQSGEQLLVVMWGAAWIEVVAPAMPVVAATVSQQTRPENVGIVLQDPAQNLKIAYISRCAARFAHRSSANGGCTHGY